MQLVLLQFTQIQFSISFISYIPFPNIDVLNTPYPKFDLGSIVRLWATMSLYFANFLMVNLLFSFFVGKLCILSLSPTDVFG